MSLECFLAAGRALGPVSNILALLCRYLLMTAVPTGSVPTVCYWPKKKKNTLILPHFLLQKENKRNKEKNRSLRDNWWKIKECKRLMTTTTTTTKVWINNGRGTMRIALLTVQLVLKASNELVAVSCYAWPGNMTGDGTEIWPTAARTVPNTHQLSFLLLLVLKTYLGQTKRSLKSRYHDPGDWDGNDESENEKMRRRV